MTRSHFASASLLVLVLLQPPSAVTTVAAQAPSTVDASYLNLLKWRSIGPSRGGRVVAVAGDPVNKFTFYQGTTGGGVWKTDDGGINWANVSDGFFKTGSVGAIAVAPSNPNVVYVGMGEACFRGNASYGDGVYKSTDAGKTWTHLGLEATRQIGRLQVDPTNPDIAYVAALGDAWGPNPDRGVYRTRDGGRTWQKVLFRSENAGAIDLVLDPGKPNVLYATTLELRRYPWGFRSAGPGTAIYKSTDGGDTWTDLSGKPGLPAGDKGRIGIALAPSRPDRVWAIIDAAGADSGDLPHRRRRRDVDAPHRQRGPHPAAVVLPSHLRRPEERRRVVGAQRGSVEVDRRRHHLPGGLGAARRQPRPVDRSAGPAADGRRQRRRRHRHVQRRQVVVHDPQPADGAALSRGHRQPGAVPRLRGAAGQHHHFGAEPLGPRAHHDRGMGNGGRRRGRLRRPQPVRSEHRLRGRSPLAAPLRPAHQAGARHLAESRDALRLGRGRHQLPLLVDLSR